MLTVISHYYNEEYLLPWWLEHHKKFFDHGVLIDYGSNDKSNEIIKKICPSWEIRPTKNQFFDAFPCDEEVQDIERGIQGYKIALNTTEFLIGKMHKLLVDGHHTYHLKSFIMCDPYHKIPMNPNYDQMLYEQCHYGLHDMGYRQSRILHNGETYPYAPGRHSHSITTDQAIILWYGLSPWNEQTIKRKLQIQHKISEASMNAGWGSHHRTNEERLNSLYNHFSLMTNDIKDQIDSLLSKP